MSADKERKRRVRKHDEPAGYQVEIVIVAGPHGAEFLPDSLTIPAGTVCLWRNQSDEPQDVLSVNGGPPFKGGPLLAGGTRLVLARRPATFAHRLASNPAAHLVMVVTEGTIVP